MEEANMSVENNDKVMKSIAEEIREEVSECCSAPPAGGLSELGFCSSCLDHTTFYWEADEDEVRAIFENRVVSL